MHFLKGVCVSLEDTQRVGKQTLFESALAYTFSFTARTHWYLMARTQALVVLLHPVCLCWNVKCGLELRVRICYWWRVLLRCVKGEVICISHTAFVYKSSSCTLVFTQKEHPATSTDTIAEIFLFLWTTFSFERHWKKKEKQLHRKMLFEKNTFFLFAV